ncbi:MAG: hypothetical protein Q9205_006240 [Flavoplaca limonia]
MILLYLLITLLIVARTNTIALNRTLTASQLQAPARVSSGRLPNPYPVPLSPIALDFLDRSTGPSVSQAGMTRLLDKARDDIMDRLKRHGDRPISHETHVIKSDGIVFVYESKTSLRILKYSEVLAVIRGFNDKGRRDESRYRLATVQYMEAPGRWVYTGDAAVLRSVGVDDA